MTRGPRKRPKRKKLLERLLVFKKNDANNPPNTDETSRKVPRFFDRIGLEEVVERVSGLSFSEVAVVKEEAMRIPVGELKPGMILYGALGNARAIIEKEWFVVPKGESRGRVLARVCGLPIPKSQFERERKIPGYRLARKITGGLLGYAKKALRISDRPSGKRETMVVPVDFCLSIYRDGGEDMKVGLTHRHYISPRCRVLAQTTGGLGDFIEGGDKPSPTVVVAEPKPVSEPIFTIGADGTFVPVAPVETLDLAYVAPPLGGLQDQELSPIFESDDTVGAEWLPLPMGTPEPTVFSGPLEDPAEPVFPIEPPVSYLFEVEPWNDFVQLVTGEKVGEQDKDGEREDKIPTKKVKIPVSSPIEEDDTPTKVIKIQVPGPIVEEPATQAPTANEDGQELYLIVLRDVDPVSVEPTPPSPKAPRLSTVPTTVTTANDPTLEIRIEDGETQEGGEGEGPTLPLSPPDYIFLRKRRPRPRPIRRRRAYARTVKELKERPYAILLRDGQESMGPDKVQAIKAALRDLGYSVPEAYTKDMNTLIRKRGKLPAAVIAVNGPRETENVQAPTKPVFIACYDRLLPKRSVGGRTVSPWTETRVVLVYDQEIGTGWQSFTHNSASARRDFAYTIEGGQMDKAALKKELPKLLAAPTPKERGYNPNRSFS